MVLKYGCVPGFYVSKSHSLSAVKTSVPLFSINNEKCMWVHNNAQQCICLLSKIARWIHFVLTIVLEASDLNCMNLQGWIRVIVIPSQLLLLRPLTLIYKYHRTFSLYHNTFFVEPFGNILYL